MRKFAIAAAALLGSASAAAQEPSNPWRQLAERDVETAYRIIAEDHPAATVEVGDTEFRARLASAHADARARAARVTSYEGLAATMAAFANALGDKHIRSRSLLTPSTLDWAGLLVVRRGDGWVVAEEERQEGEAALSGARLVACDGIDVDRLAEQRLGGFRAIWAVPAQRIATAPLLLIDDGNPFLTRPASCTFVVDGEEREVALRWRAARRVELAPRINALVKSGAPGFGVRRSGAGWWIALQSLSDQAIPVVEAVRGQAAEMRTAPFVVMDLRGNGGGNSVYGDQIAEALLGEAAVRGDVEGQDCYPVWRTSARNLAELAEIARGAEARMGADAALFWGRQHERAQAARAAGQELSGPATCAAPAEAAVVPAVRPPSLFRGRLIVLTDHLCFSSCLLVADRFRSLGALHVGEATDAATRYFEVREERLPSGVIAFSTLQAMSRSSPYQIGPFTPHHVFDGDISDTTALEAWVPSLLSALVKS